MDKRFSNLLNLLDDPDESIGRFAMGELLTYGVELEPRLAELQESANPILRRRGHQLQSTLHLRERRRNFIHLIENPDADLATGLIQLHLQWFDNDADTMMATIWNRLAEAAAKNDPGELNGLAYFLRKYPLNYTSESTLVPEHYCLGPILDDKTGAPSILCAIAKKLAENAGLKLEIFRLMGDFVLFDPVRNKLLNPRDNWQIADAPKLENQTFWNNGMLLKYGAAMLFSHAVNSDSFRYVHTLAQALSGANDGESFQFLPYPYRYEE